MAKKHKCAVCDGPFEKKISTTQKVCSPKCAYIHGQQKVKTKLEKEDRRLKRQAKKIDAVRKADFLKNDRNYQLELTQKVFNKMRVREELVRCKRLGIAPTCISCGNEIGGDIWSCGHYKTVKGFGRIRFSRFNTFLQHNRRCNKDLSGDITGTSTTKGYQQGLIDRFGETSANRLMDFCQRQRMPYQWDCEQLIKMRAMFSKKTRDLERILYDYFD